MPKCSFCGKPATWHRGGWERPIEYACDGCEYERLGFWPITECQHLFDPGTSHCRVCGGEAGSALIAGKASTGEGKA